MRLANSTLAMPVFVLFSLVALVDEIFPEQPVRQWALSVPFPLRFLFASRPAVMGRVLGIVYRLPKTGCHSIRIATSADRCFPAVQRAK